MKFPDFIRVDKWATRKLSYPGIDKNTLAQKKIYWLASVAVTSMILCLTLTYHILFPQLRIIIYYGLFISAIFMQGVIFPLFLRQISILWRFIDQTLVAISTFVCILLMGGIPYSGGLVFVGFALVFFSLNFREKRYTIGISIIYFITVILAGILHPYLSVPAEMTPSVNVSLFVINLLWISGFAMVFIMNFISLRVKSEQNETLRLKEIDKEKTRLYTNITHEFRTPLTIITGMNNLIREDPGRWLDEGTMKIDANAAILLNLVNHMLDLSKIEAGALPVKMIKGNIIKYISFIVELFRSVADRKDITLIYNQGSQGELLDYDPDKIMQITGNLLSNALKYTQQGGRVEVSTIFIDQSEYKIIVSDNGPGIDQLHLPHIFDRFYRIDESGDKSCPGAGLGLALTRELVKLLGGEIEAHSTRDEGSVFIVTLPVTCNAQPGDSSSFDQKAWTGEAAFMQAAYTGTDKFRNIRGDNDRPLLLVVEDNSEVVQYLVTLVEDEYDIIVASDGNEGERKAIEFVPDIILSDIMMPGIDGIELLNRLKNDMRTSHIPFVILTARADIESRLEGIETGADAFISKPFNREELLVQLRSLVNLRKRLRERYSGMDLPRLTGEKHFTREDEFMLRVREAFNSSVGDESFDIDRLCKDMAMSRTQLYRKFKSLTDTTPGDYFLSIRLHKAKEMLATDDISVTEASYRAGFKNVSHFSKTFKQKFGVNPSKIRN